MSDSIKFQRMLKQRSAFPWIMESDSFVSLIIHQGSAISMFRNSSISLSLWCWISQDYFQGVIYVCFRLLNTRSEPGDRDSRDL